MKKKLYFLAVLAIVGTISGVSFAATSDAGSITPTIGGVNGGGIATVAAATSGQPSWTPAASSAGAITAGTLYNIDTTSTGTAYSGDLLITLYLTNPDQLVGAYTYLTSLINVKAAYNTATDEAVGTGNGTTTVFTLDNAPVCGGSETVKVDGTAQTRGTDYTINYKTGTITFTAAPAAAKAVTATYKYYDSTQSTYETACLANGDTVPTSYLTLANGYVSFIVAGDSAGAKYRVTVDDGTYYCVTTSVSANLSPTYYLTMAQA